MNRADILAFLEALAPPETAESWDNPGLLADGGERETDAVLVTLDITSAAIKAAQAAGASLIVSHHPVLFTPVRRLAAGEVLYELVQAGLSAYAAHTNLDKAAGGVNDRLAQRLGLEEVKPAPDGLCRIGRLSRPMEAAAFAAHTAACLGTAVRFSGSGPVSRVGVCGGAGGGEALALAGRIDAFVTGEVKHHEWLAAAAAGMSLVDAGHYATEAPVVEALAARLREAFPALRVEAFTGAPPYEICTP